MKEAGFEDALEAFFNYKVSSLYTAINCRVVSVRTSLTDQRIDVQPLPKAVMPDETTKDRPIITNVPVVFPASSKASLTFPIDVGDTVLCIFSQRSLDTFKASTEPSTYTPNDARKFSIRDAIAIPGLFSFPEAINDPEKRKWPHSTRDLVIVNNIGSDTECEIRLQENGNISVKTDQDFYATFRDGLIECRNLTLNCENNLTVSVGQTTEITSNELNVTVGASTVVSSPTTNWTGAFNLAGPFTQTGGSSGGTTATFNVPIQINADIDVVSGDLTVDGVSYKTHYHTDSQGGTTTPPVGF